MMLSAAALFVCALVQLLDKPDLFTTLVSILGLGGASALAYSGYLRLSGKASGPAGMLVCLYLAALLICRFRGWSADPLLGDYCFELLAVVASMVAAYQLAGFPLGKGRRRASIFCSMAAVFSAAFLWQIPDGPTALLCRHDFVAADWLLLSGKARRPDGESWAVVLRKPRRRKTGRTLLEDRRHLHRRSLLRQPRPWRLGGDSGIQRT